MSFRYVVGVDGSAPSASAADWAARRARRDGATLHLVHVVDPEAGLMGADAEAEAHRTGVAVLAEAVARIREAFPGVEARGELLTGVPAWTIAGFAHPDDVVVVGTGKTGYVSGRILGSRSVQFALAVHGDVAVVPEADLRFRDGVVAGIDREETAELIARRAAREAAEHGTRLTLVHAVPPDAVPAARARAEGPLARAVEAARAVDGRLEIRSRVSVRTPAEALLDASRGSALLVVGPGSTAETRSPLGSTLHIVLLNANAPVLVVRG